MEVFVVMDIRGSVLVVVLLVQALVVGGLVYSVYWRVVRWRNQRRTMKRLYGDDKRGV